MPWYIIALLCFNGVALIFYSIVAISAVLALAGFSKNLSLANRLFYKLFCYGVLLYPLTYGVSLGIVTSHTDNHINLIFSAIPAVYISLVIICGFVWKKIKL
jgi:hypothetical protein